MADLAANSAALEAVIALPEASRAKSNPNLILGFAFAKSKAVAAACCLAAVASFCNGINSLATTTPAAAVAAGDI